MGGFDSPVDSESRGGSSRAPDGARAEGSDFEGEGGAGDEAEAEKDGADGSDDTDEATATPSAPAPKKDEKKPATEGPAAPAAAATTPAAPCDDTSGSEPGCGELQSGACGSVFGPLCEQLGAALKPKVATAIVQCLVENNRRSRCESIEECLERGLEQVCVAPPDREVCEKLFARCDPPEEGPWQDVDHCAKGVASLKKAARAKVVECLEDSCGLETCFLKAGT